MADSIRIPVSLEVLQSSIKEVEQAASNIKVGSDSWKELQGILRKLHAEADSLTVAFARPFNTQNQFNSAQKSLSKINDLLSKVQITAGRVTFKDLQLTPQQETTFKGLEKQIRDIENEITKFKSQLRQQLTAQDSDISKDLIAIDPNIVSKSFDEIVKIVEKKTKAIENAKKAAEATLQSDEYKQAQKRRDATAKFLADGMTRAGMGDQGYEKVFNTKGNLRSKGLMVEWAKENLTLPQGELDALLSKSAADVKSYFENLRLNPKDILSNADKQVKLASNGAPEAIARYEALQRVLKSLSDASEQLRVKQDSLAGPLQNAKDKLNDFQNGATNAARASGNMTNAQQAVVTQTNALSNALSQCNDQWISMQRTTDTFNGIRNAIVNFMGFNQVLNLTKTAIKNAMNHIKELDSVMNKISIVTDMSTGDLWNQVDAYSDMARTYGVSIKGAYEVSQIYYQQGLQTNDVLTLTNETLKLAKISGLDYAKTTDYMTTALRGFKMEMSEASTVVDVYSALAAHTAVSQEELAVAMSKTASSMEGVGATFQEASSMIGTMVAVTRESATNIGTALKSIASRYGELTKDPSTLVDEDGQALAFNKVDAALQSVGITMRTVDGQFRSFTDVIIELGEKWDQLDSTQQRYIATQFAGNRQQSRFLALVSNVDMLKSNLDVAMNSEDTGTLQALKALDSIESKIEQVKVSYQQFYTTIGAENIWKGALDGLKNYIDTLNGLPKLFNKIPIGAIGMIATLVSAFHKIGDMLITHIAKVWQKATPGTDFAVDIGKNVGQGVAQGVTDSADIIADALGKALSGVGAQVQGATQSAVANAAEQGVEKSNIKESNQQGQQLSTPQALKDVDFEQQLQRQVTEQAVDLSSIATVVTDRINNIVASINSASPQVAITFAEMGKTAALEFLNALATNMGAGPEVASRFSEELTRSFQVAAQNNFKDILTQGLSGIDITQSDEPLDEMINALRSKSEELKTLSNNIGSDVVRSIVMGILSGEGEATAEVKALGAALIQALRSGLDTHSPSPTIIAICKMAFGESIAMGIAESIDQAMQGGKSLGEAMVESLQKALDNGQLNGDSLEAAAQNLFEKISEDREFINSKAYKATKKKRDAYTEAFNAAKTSGAPKPKLTDYFNEEEIALFKDRPLNNTDRRTTADQFVKVISKIQTDRKNQAENTSGDIDDTLKADIKDYVPVYNQLINAEKELNRLKQEINNKGSQVTDADIQALNEAQKKYNALNEQFKRIRKEQEKLLQQSQSASEKEELSKKSDKEATADDSKPKTTRKSQKKKEEQESTFDSSSYDEFDAIQAELETIDKEYKKVKSHITGLNNKKGRYRNSDMKGKKHWDDTHKELGGFSTEEEYKDYLDTVKKKEEIEKRQQELTSRMNKIIDEQISPRAKVIIKEANKEPKLSPEAERRPAVISDERERVESIREEIKAENERQRLESEQNPDKKGQILPSKSFLIDQLNSSTVSHNDIGGYLTKGNFGEEVLNYSRQAMTEGISSDFNEQIFAMIQRAIDSGEIDGNQLINTYLKHHFEEEYKASAFTAERALKDGGVSGERKARTRIEEYEKDLAWYKELKNRIVIPEDTEKRHAQYSIEKGYEERMREYQQEANAAEKKHAVRESQPYRELYADAQRTSNKEKIAKYAELLKPYDELINSIDNGTYQAPIPEYRIESLNKWRRQALADIGIESSESTTDESSAHEDKAKAMEHEAKAAEKVSKAEKKGAKVVADVKKEEADVKSEDSTKADSTKATIESETNAYEQQISALESLLALRKEIDAATKEGKDVSEKQAEFDKQKAEYQEKYNTKANFATASNIKKMIKRVEEKAQSEETADTQPKSSMPLTDKQRQTAQGAIAGSLKQAEELKKQAEQEHRPIEEPVTFDITPAEKKGEELKEKIESTPVEQKVEVTAEEQTTPANVEPAISEQSETPEVPVVGVLDTESTQNNVNESLGETAVQITIDDLLTDESTVEEAADNIGEALGELFENDDGQLSFFDNLANASEEAAEEVSDNAESIQQSQGQLRFDENGLIDTSELEREIARLESYEPNYDLDVYESETGGAPIPMDESMSEYPRQLDTLRQQLAELRRQNEETTRAMAEGARQAANGVREQSQATDELNSKWANLKNMFKDKETAGKWAQGIGAGLSTVAGFIDTATLGGEVAKKSIMAIGGAISFVGAIWSHAGPMAYISAAITAVSALISLIQSFGIDAQIERAKKQAEELSNKAKEAKANYNTLDKGIEKIKELEKTRYESKESAEEYQSAIEELTDKFPHLISGYDEAGNAIINVQNAEIELAKQREQTAQATYNAAKAELETNKLEAKKKRSVVNTQQGAIDEYLRGQRSSNNGISYDNKEELTSRLREATKDQDGVLNTDRALQLAEAQDGTMDALIKLAESWKVDITDLQSQRSELDQQIENYLSMDDKTSSDARKLFDSIMQKIDTSEDESFKEVLENYIASLGEYLDYEQKVDSGNQILYTSWQQLNKNNGKDWRYLNKSTAATSMLSYYADQAMNHQLKEPEGSNITYTLDDYNWNHFVGDAQKSMEVFISKLTDEQLKQFNQMASNPENYSSEDFVEVFGNIEGFSGIQEVISTYFVKSIEYLQENLKNNFKSITGSNADEYSGDNQFYKTYIENIGQVTSSAEREFLTSSLKQYQELLDSGFGGKAATFGTQTNELFTLFKGLPQDIENEMWAAVKEKGLRTYEGISAIMGHADSITDTKKREQFRSILQLIYDNIIPNINLEIQTAMSNLLDTWEDTSKTLKAASTSGVSLKEADDLISQASAMSLDLSLESDFEWNGDKLVMTAEAFKEYWNKLNESTTTSVTSWQSVIDNANAVLVSIEGENQSATRKLFQSKDTFKSLGINIEEYINSEGLVTSEKMEELRKKIQESQKNLDEFTKAQGIAADQILADYAFSQGKYLKKAGETDLENGETFTDAELTKIARGKDSDVQAESWRKAKVRKSLNNAYGNLLSDVVTKGFENVNFDDYEGLIETDKAQLEELKKNNDVEKLITWYAVYAGKSLEEVDELLAQAVQTRIRPVTSTIAELVAYNNTTKGLSKTAKSVLQEKLGTTQINSDNALQSAAQLLATLADGIGEAGFTLQDYNAEAKSILEAALNKNGGKERGALSFVSGDINANAFESFANSLGMQLDQMVNVDTGEVKGQIASHLSFNKTTGKFDIKGSFEEFIAALNEQFGLEIEIGSEAYKEAYNAYIDAQIAENEKHNAKSRETSQIQKLISGKVGETVNVVDLSPELKKALDISGDTFEILSEYQRDSMILAIDLMTISNKATQQAIKEAQDSIRSKRAKGTALEGIISKTFSKDAAEKFIDTVKLDPDEVVDTKLYMETLGFDWDEYNQTFKATKKALDTIRYRISEAEKPNSGASAEYIANLKTLANQLEIDLDKNPAEEALRALLSNYNNAEGQIAAFKTYFESDTFHVDDYTYTDIDGVVKVKVDELRAALGDKWSEYFDTVIAQLADEYISNASKAGELVSKGTTSQVDIQAFKQAYSQLMGGQEIDFYYDSVLKAWTFDASYLRTFVEKQADQLKLVGEERKQWIKDQIDSFTVDNLDFSQFVSGTTTDREYQLLKKNLQDYYKTHTSGFMPYMGTLKEWSLKQTEETLKVLSEGGQYAVDELQRIKPDATAEEIKAVYRAQVDPILSVIDSLEDLQKGSIVSENQISILRAAGVQVNNDGVIQSAVDVAAAYQSLYNQLVASGDATIAELNKTTAAAMSFKYKGKKSISDTLSKGALAFEDLANIYTAQGKIFNENELATLNKYIDINELGEIKVTDFKGLASQLGWEAGSKEYEAAYRSFIDSIISDNEKYDATKLVVSQISTFASAELGKQINVTDLPQEIKEQLGITGDLVEIANEAQRDNLLLAIDTSTITNEQLRKEITDIQSNIRNKRGTKLSGWEKVIQDKVSENDARAFSMAYTGTEERYAAMMEAIGYIWDENIQQFVSSDTSVERIQQLLEQEKDSLTDEGYNRLLTLSRNLEDLKTYGPINSIKDVLTNYTNISNEMVEEFNNQFKDLDLQDYLTTDTQGKRKVKIKELGDALAKYGYDIQEVLGEELASIANSYMQDISQSISLVSQGTTSVQDIEAFIQSYKDLGFTGDVNQLFSYDKILKSWTLDPTVLKDYIQKQSEQLQELGYDVTSWYNDQLEIFATNVDITSYLNATDRSNTGEAFKQLTNAMVQYFTVEGLTQDEIEERINSDIQALNAGGDAMIAVIRDWADRAGKQITDDEIDQILSQEVSRVTDKYSGIIKELVNFTSRDNLSQVTKAAELELSQDGQAIELSAENALGAASAFLNTLAEQIGKAGYTLEDYNAEAKSILDKTLFNRGGAGRALLNFASNEIDSSALESLANSLGLQLNDLVNVLTGEVEGAMGQYLRFDQTTGLYEITGTFSQFVAALQTEFGITIDKYSKSYVAALKTWNDAAISKEHEIDKAITEELTSITEAKAGDKLNLAQTYSTVLESIGAWGMKELRTELEGFGATISSDGILTILNNANIPGIIQALSQKAAEAGQLIPEELENLNEKLAEVLRNIASLISNGINGSISGENKRQIENWAEQYGITDLQFRETAEGYKLATESAKELYRTISAIDSLQGQVVFEALKDNLIETDERFKSSQANAAYIAELEEKIAGGRSVDFGGNADLYKHAEHKISREEMIAAGWTDFTGDYATTYGSEYTFVRKGKAAIGINISPIDDDGNVMSPAELDAYVENIEKQIDQKGLSKANILDADPKHLIMGINEASDASQAAQKKMEEELGKQGELIHQNQEALAEADKPNDARIQQYKEELALAQKIAETRGLTEDNSFKFMEQDIPSGQKNPLNYWENWSKAYEAINKSRKGNKDEKGRMGYEDFYNLITEMGNLAKITGKSVQIGKNVKVNAENAASLIEQAAGALEVQSDGSLKINLSKIGVDFASGADAMNGNIDEGINKLADSQIEMLDSLIGLLETIVTMEEAFKNVDVDSDAKLSLDELFELDSEGNPEKFTKAWEDQLEKLREMLDPKNLEKYNEDFARGMESIKFNLNGQMMSLADIIRMDFDDVVKEGGIGASFYNALMESIYQAAQDGTYDETTVKEIIMEHLRKGLEDQNVEIVFDMGNYTFIGTGKATVEIDWDKASTKQAVEKFGKEKVKNAAIAMAHQETTAEQFQIYMATQGKIYLKNDKWTVTYVDENGTKKEVSETDKAWKEALAAKALEGIEGVHNIKLGEEGSGTATAKVTLGNMEVEVESDTTGKQYWVDSDGKKHNTSRELVDAEIEKKWNEAIKFYDFTNESSEQAQKVKRQIQFETEVQYGFTNYSLNQQSYQNLNEEVRKKLEDALKSGNTVELNAVIDANTELAELKGLTSDQILEKLGLKEIPITFKGDTEEATKELTALSELADKLTEPYTVTVTPDPSITTTQEQLNSVVTSLQNIVANKDVTITTTYKTEGTPPSIPQPQQNTQKSTTPVPKAAGTVGLANAAGTLMGELGPELVVSNGRYFVAGQNGAEFVDLADDAIVFNHMQTEQLLKNGMSPSRGKAVTSERNAISFASGNVNGGAAMASASSVLATLKQLRAMWESLKKASVKDLASKGGGGGGGGGGKTDTPERKAWIEAVERWYNLMQKIAQLERDITHEEALRTKLQGEFQKNGRAYYASQKRTLQDIEQQSMYQMQLNISQEEYFNQRRKALNESEFSRLYTFDENGTIQYNDSDLGFAWLSDLVTKDEYGNTKYTNEEQYNRIVAEGYGAYMQQDSSGALIEMEKDENGELKEDQSAFYAKAIEAWWDTIDGQKEEMESLKETIDEGKTKVLELESQRNEILKEIRDNQMKVEDNVLKAIESSRQNEIDALSKERQALQDASTKYIEGLNNALNKERQMYEQQEDAEELNRKRRQLDILRRSGGSGSQIRSLESEIQAGEKESYFTQQQNQIDAIKEASDLELERLDQQIEIMNETLEYQKEMGLLWGEVEQIMELTPEQITTFIMEHDSEMWDDSPLKTEEQFQQAMFEAEQWRAFAEDANNIYNQSIVNHAEDQATMADAVYGGGADYNWGLFNTAMRELYGDQWEEVASQFKGTFMANYSKTGDITYAATEVTNALNNIGSQMTNALESSYNAYKQAAQAKAAEESGGGGGGGNGSGSSSNSGSNNNQRQKYSGVVAYYGPKGLESKAVTVWASSEEEAHNKFVNAVPANRSYYGPGSTYDHGGMVPEDQIALVHAKEAVLTPQQASILRNDILGSKPTSLMNLLLDFRDATSGMATDSDYNSIDRTGLVIENANVNMNVQKIANDYDAQRAGEQALQEMIRIARKTSAKNSVRR